MNDATARTRAPATPGQDDTRNVPRASNVKLYPKFHQYFRKSKPPLLAIWGKNDPFFLPARAEAFRKDLPSAKVQFVDTGHFALETHVVEISVARKEFLRANGVAGR